MNGPILEHARPDEVRSERIRSLLDQVAGDALTPTGTPVGRALHDLFMIEVRLRGAALAEEAWLGLDACAVRQLVERFETLFTGPGGANHLLPGGAVMGSIQPGVGFVDDRRLSFDVDEPGLHRLEDLPERPGGSNLELLLRHVDLCCRERPCGAIGRPAFVERFISGNWSYVLRFPPFDPAGGVILERSLNYATAGTYFCALSPPEVREIASDIVEDMVDLWTNNRVIAAPVIDARNAAKWAAAKLKGVRFDAVTVRLNEQTHVRPHALGVEFDAIDDALRPGIVKQFIRAGEEASEALDVHGLSRSAELEQLRRSGADGRIDELALSIAIASEEGLASLLGQLAERYEVYADIAVPSGRHRFRLFWHDGIIRASSWDTPRFQLWRNEIRIKDRRLPSTIVTSLLGQPLSRVFDSPFRCDSLIRSIVDYDAFLLIETEPGSRLVNCKRREVWPRPSS